MSEHRCCTNEEHDPSRGLYAGCCHRCGQPWPCSGGSELLALRDEFAMAALSGNIRGVNNLPADLALQAYAVADAMLAERLRAPAPKEAPDAR